VHQVIADETEHHGVHEEAIVGRAAGLGDLKEGSELGDNRAHNTAN